MYKCIHCLRVLNETDTEGWVFQKGIYIEPGTGARIHLGICHTCQVGSGVEKLTVKPIEHRCVPMDTVNDWLPIYDYILDFRQQH
ncbi:DUF3973 domain-containing protein [Paenibacillus guangzhouensis]|uniref:DUF3973 domain-containing protein n=1 Tax=Paenibacillus guangzhouensis TaxID=1473112 RepID=UPI0012668CD5